MHDLSPLSPIQSSSILSAPFYAPDTPHPFYNAKLIPLLSSPISPIRSATIPSSHLYESLLSPLQSLSPNQSNSNLSSIRIFPFPPLCCKVWHTGDLYCIVLHWYPSILFYSMGNTGSLYSKSNEITCNIPPHANVLVVNIGVRLTPNRHPPFLFRAMHYACTMRTHADCYGVCIIST